MNINISGDQDEMSAPARQGPLDHQIYDAMDQATTPRDIVARFGRIVLLR
jgi:hypothetical protein